MKKFSLFFLLALSAFFLLAADNPKIPPMPVAVSGNAVASLKNGLELFSLMGVGPKRTWDDVTNKVYMLRLSSGKWSESRPVPGVGGRLGASAIGARGQVFLFGGYLVDAQGEEITVPDVNSYLPEDHRWYRGTDIPVAVDRADGCACSNQFESVEVVGWKAVTLGGVPSKPSSFQRFTILSCVERLSNVDCGKFLICRCGLHALMRTFEPYGRASASN